MAKKAKEVTHGADVLPRGFRADQIDFAPEVKQWPFSSAHAEYFNVKGTEFESYAALVIAAVQYVSQSHVEVDHVTVELIEDDDEPYIEVTVWGQL